MSEEQLTDQEQQRRQKLARLREAGIEPYPARATRTHTTTEAIAALQSLSEGDDPVVVTIVGRLVAIRVMGKSSFVHIEDGSGRRALDRRRNVSARTVGSPVRVMNTGPLASTKSPRSRFCLNMA